MKKAAALAVIIATAVALAVTVAGFWEGPGRTAGFTWDEAVLASFSTSTLDIVVPADEVADDGAWGSSAEVNITW